MVLSRNVRVRDYQAVFSCVVKQTSLAMLGVILLGCAELGRPSAYRPLPAELHLAEVLVHRLELARRVAWIKFQDQLPVRNPAREAAMLASIVGIGTSLGIPEAETRRVFDAQLHASRLAQRKLISAWSRGATLPAYPPASLERDIRPRIDAVNREILLAWKHVPRRSPAFAEYVEKEIRRHGFSWDVARAATAPLVR